MWATLIAAVLPKMLDWFGVRLAGLAGWLWSKYQSSSDRRAESKEVSKEVERVRIAIDQAFDGNPITKEEKSELVNSFRELVRDY